MKTWPALIIAVAAACVFSTRVPAQTQDAKPVGKSPTTKSAPSMPSLVACGCCKQGGASQTSPVILALDIDKDGVISPAEIRNAQQSLSALDLNGDGKLSRVEMHAQTEIPETNVPVVSKNQIGVTKDFYVQKMLQKYDRNLNGQIDRNELSGRMLSMVDMIDSDGDRILTYDELLNLDNQIRLNLQGRNTNQPPAKPKRGQR